MKRINRYTVKLVKEGSGLYEVDQANIGSPEAVRKLLNSVFDLESDCVEKFGIIVLNTKNSVCGIHIITSGTLNASLIHPREVFQAALLHLCNSIILFHNHPSGDPDPSQEDKITTERLVDAGKILGIQVMDHIIIGHDRYVSLKEWGLI